MQIGIIGNSLTHTILTLAHLEMPLSIQLASVSESTFSFDGAAGIVNGFPTRVVPHTACSL